MGYFREMYGSQSKEFIRGVVAGLKAYAYWKDGVEYVDYSTVQTLKLAVEEICGELGWKEDWGNA